MLTLEHIENFGRPFRIGAIVEGEHHLVRTVTVTPHPERFWQRLKIFVGDQFCLRIDGKVASAMSGVVLDPKDFAPSFHVDILARWHVTHLVSGTGVARNVPNTP